MQRESGIDAYKQYHAPSYEEIGILSGLATSGANYNGDGVSNPILDYKITLDLGEEKLADVYEATPLHRIYFLSRLVENLEKGISVYQDFDLVKYLDNQISDELAEKLTRNQLRCEKVSYFEDRLALYDDFMQEGMLTNTTVNNIASNLEPLCILRQHFDEQNYHFKPDHEADFNIKFVICASKQNEKLEPFLRKLHSKELTLSNCGIGFFDQVYLHLGDVLLEGDGKRRKNVILARLPLEQVTEFMEIVTYFNLRQKLAKELSHAIIGRNLILSEGENTTEVDFVVFDVQRNLVILAAEGKKKQKKRDRRKYN